MSAVQLIGLIERLHPALDGCFGASAIQCCYAAMERRESSTLTNMVESKNTNGILCTAKKLVVEEKISLKVSRLVVNPACMAGVRTSIAAKIQMGCSVSWMIVRISSA
jgi:hypothetical protein